MSKKTLNQANLEKLGAEKLAALVMDLVEGSAALQRRARMGSVPPRVRGRLPPISANASPRCAARPASSIGASKGRWSRISRVCWE